MIRFCVVACAEAVKVPHLSGDKFLCEAYADKNMVDASKFSGVEMKSGEIGSPIPPLNGPKDRVTSVDSTQRKNKGGGT